MIRFPHITWRPLAFLVGLGVLIYLVLHLGPGNLASSLTAVGARFLWMPLVYGLGTAVHAFGLQVFLRPSIRPNLSGALASRFGATTLNTILPLVGVGGEPSRLLWLPPSSRTQGTPALILDRIVFVLADALFLIVSVLVVVLRETLPRHLAWWAWATGLVALILGATLYWVSSKRGLAVPFIKFLSLVGFKRKSLMGSAQGIDQEIRDIWTRNPEKILKVFAIHFVGRVLVISEVWIGLWILGVPLTVTVALVVSSLQIALGLVLSFIPSQLGVHEAAQALVFNAMGLNPVLGVSLVLLQRIRQLLYTPIGFGLLSRAPKF